MLAAQLSILFLAGHKGFEPLLLDLESNLLPLTLMTYGVSSQNRTDINGFADHCLTTRPSTQMGSFHSPVWVIPTRPRTSYHWWFPHEEPWAFPLWKWYPSQHSLPAVEHEQKNLTSVISHEALHNCPWTVSSFDLSVEDSLTERGESSPTHSNYSIYYLNMIVKFFWIKLFLFRERLALC